MNIKAASFRAGRMIAAHTAPPAIFRCTKNMMKVIVLHTMSAAADEYKMLNSKTAQLNNNSNQQQLSTQQQINSTTNHPNNHSTQQQLNPTTTKLNACSTI